MSISSFSHSAISNGEEQKAADVQSQNPDVPTDVTQDAQNAVASSSKHTLDMAPPTNGHNAGLANGKHERSETDSDGPIAIDGEERLAKRVKLAHKLNYRKGLFLAPMVRTLVSIALNTC